MKNLKLLYEKVNEGDWEESLGKEPIEKRSKRMCKRRAEHQYCADKQNLKLRLTWE